MSDRLATVRSALVAECLVAALCLDCDRVHDLDLDDLARRGFADRPLIYLPLTCSACRSRNCRVIVSGRAYRE